MNGDLPFKTEYAKTNKSVCKKCRRKIDKDVLRLAEIVHNPFSDKMRPDWYHVECFFQRHSPSSILQIGGLNTLNNSDQERIANLVEVKLSRSDQEIWTETNYMKDVEVDYNNRSGVYCEHCSEDIEQGGVCVLVGGRAWCAPCFGAARGPPRAVAGAAPPAIRGLTRLSPPDQALFQRIIGGPNSSCKKMEEEILSTEQSTSQRDEAEAMEEDGARNLNNENELQGGHTVDSRDEEMTTTSEHTVGTDNGDMMETYGPKTNEEIMKEQNDLFQHYKQALEGVPNLNQILIENDQKIIGYAKRKEHLADCMAFGALERCPLCQGQLVLDTFYYKCTGAGAWGACPHHSTQPRRRALRVPERHSAIAPFHTYEPRVARRQFRDPPHEECQPLKNLEFYIYTDEIDENINKDEMGVFNPQNNVWDDPQHDDDSVVPLCDAHDSGVSLYKSDYSIQQQNEEDSDLKLHNDDWSTPQRNDVSDFSYYTEDESDVSPLKVGSGITQDDVDRGIPKHEKDYGVLHQNYSNASASVYDKMSEINDTNASISNDDPKVDVSASKDADVLSVKADTGDSDQSREALAVASRIVALGGAVSGAVRAELAAVVWLRDPRQLTITRTRTLQRIAELDIQVVHKSFFDLLDTEQGTAEHTQRFISEENIADWGTDRATRLGIQNTSGAWQPTEVNLGVVKYRAIDGAVLEPLCGAAGRRVLLGADGAPLSAALTHTDVHTGQNSYYYMQLLADDHDRYWVSFAWGRIGTNQGGTQTIPCQTFEQAMEKFVRKFEDKTGNKWEDRNNFIKLPKRYYFQEKEYAIAPPPPPADSGAALPGAVELLVRKIFDIEEMQRTLVEFEIDTSRLPLGKITDEQLRRAGAVLDELEALAASRDRHALQAACNRFYALVPHRLGARGALPVLGTPAAVARKRCLLRQLLDTQITYNMLCAGAGDVRALYAQLRSDICPLPRDTAEFTLLRRCLRTTHAPTHQYTLHIQQAYKVTRHGESSRYQKYSGLHNRRLLWHGSRLTNFAGILSQGLRIAPPEAEVTGHMFGPGVYFADVATKAAHYCYSVPASPFGLLLLCEVALGTMKECLDAEYMVSPPAGAQSVWGVGRSQPAARRLPGGLLVPLGPLEPTHRLSELLYNEFVVYDVDQINVKYLLLVKFDFVAGTHSSTSTEG